MRLTKRKGKPTSALSLIIRHLNSLPLASPEEGVTASDLAVYAGVEESTVHSTMSELQQQGFISAVVLPWRKEDRHQPRRMYFPLKRIPFPAVSPHGLGSELIIGILNELKVGDQSQALSTFDFAKLGVSVQKTTIRSFLWKLEKQGYIKGIRERSKWVNKRGTPKVKYYLVKKIPVTTFQEQPVIPQVLDEGTKSHPKEPISGYRKVIAWLLIDDSVRPRDNGFSMEIMESVVGVEDIKIISVEPADSRECYIKAGFKKD